MTVSANATDNAGVAGVQFTLDGANLGAEVTTAPYAVAWNTSAAAAGTHTLTAVARDAAGNTTASAPVSVTKPAGGTAPTVSITAPPDGSWTGNSLHVTATASSSGAALTTLKLYGNGGVVMQTACSGTTCTLDDWWTTGPLPNGAYQMQAVATDAAGASTTSSPPVTIYKNATTPVVPSRRARERSGARHDAADGVGDRARQRRDGVRRGDGHRDRERQRRRRGRAVQARRREPRRRGHDGARTRSRGTPRATARTAATR